MSRTSLIEELKSLQKTKRKLARDIRNLEETIYGKNPEELLIPGKKLPVYKQGKSQKAYYVTKKTMKAPNFKFQKFNSDILLTPIVATEYNFYNDTILVNTVAFVNRKQDPQHFELFFNYTLSEEGQPQISIYICYHAPEIAARKYNIRPFAICFKTKSINNGSGKKVPLRDIKTIKVFLVNTDPKTSRGTMTTVQNHIPGS